MDIGPKIATMIDATEHPLRVRNKLEQSYARAIRGRPIHRETTVSARFNANRAVRGDGMADAGLRSGGRDDDRLTNRSRRA
jgi:hypothetical protein